MTRRSFRLVRIAISAALYVALSLAIAPLTYGQMQIRFSEIMILLCFFHRDYCLAMILGCAITNAFSPLGIIDVLFGTLGTAISALFIRLCSKIWLTWIPPVVCTIFVALEFYITASEPFWLSFATIGAGEFIAVALIGMPVIMLLARNKRFLEMIGPDDRYYRLMSKGKASTHDHEESPEGHIVGTDDSSCHDSQDADSNCPANSDLDSSTDNKSKHTSDID